MEDHKTIIEQMKTDEDYRVRMQKFLDEMTPDQYRAFLEDDSWLGVPYARSFFHIHSDLGSPLDAILTVKQYQERAKFYGASYLSLTDHGTMYGLIPLDDLINKSNKSSGKKQTLIVGCELYVCEDVEHRGLRKHLCAYALDETGYEVLCHLVTQSQYRIIQVGNIQYPCVSFGMLEEYMGPGAPGHGHIALTSACIGGVVAGAAASAFRAGKRIEKTQETLDYLKSLKEHGSPEEIDNAVGYRGADAKAVDRLIRKAEAGLEKDEAMMVPGADDPQTLQREMLKYDELAGHGFWYVEMQYHGIDVEKRLMPVIAAMAEANGIPLIAANDAHMRDRGDAELRKYLNSMRFGNTWDPLGEGDTELYLKTDQELYRALREILPPDPSFLAMMGREKLASQCSFHYSKKERFPKYYE